MSENQIPVTDISALPKDQQPFWPQARRALHFRCPNCGEGKLYKAYLRQVDECSVCGTPLGKIRADDGPAWLTILLVGHLTVPLLLEVEKHATWPTWVPMVIWPIYALSLSLIILPFAKALFITILWRKQ